MRLFRLAFILPSLALTACGDDPPPIPKGGWQVQFSQTGQSCPAASHNAAVGVVSGSDVEELVADGDGGDRVTCTVTSSSIDGQVSSGPDSLKIRVTSIGADNTSDNPATGSVSFVSSSSIKLYSSTSDSPCEFYFNDNGQGIEGGDAWVSFRCPQVQADQSVCSILQGFAAFQDCN